MKPYLHPVPIACAVLAVGAAVLGSLPLMVLSLIVGVAAVGLLSARQAQDSRPGAAADDLSPDGKMLLRPLRKLADDIETLVEQNRGSSTIQIIGSDARKEAAGLLSQVARSLVERDELKRSLRGRYEAQKEIDEANTRLPSASDVEKASLESAVEARTVEIKHYAEIEERVKRIESGVTQAESVLAEMKARLSLSASGEKAAAGSDDELRETIARLKNLSSSYDEAEQVIRGQ